MLASHISKKKNIRENIILFDTSAFSRLDYIKTIYPNFTENRFAIGTTTFFESKIESNKNNKHHIVQLMVDERDLITWELVKILPSVLASQVIKRNGIENFPLVNESTYSICKAYIEGRGSKEDNEKVKKLSEISNREDCEQVWVELLQKVPLKGKVQSMNLNNINEELKQLLNIIREENYKRESYPELIKEFFDLCFNAIRELGENRFREIFLAACIILKLQVFWNLLLVHSKAKPKDKHGNINCIELNIENKTIILNKNSFKDLKLSAPYLPYITKFVSMDQGQSELLKILFPEYKNKIVYVSQK